MPDASLAGLPAKPTRGQPVPAPAAFKVLYDGQCEICQASVQGGFTVLTIIACGTLTLMLHAELLRGDRAALGLACFIGIYWTTRILVEAFYFSHSDWPQGKQFAVGHILLISLFSVLAASYLGLFTWHLLQRSQG